MDLETLTRETIYIVTQGECSDYSICAVFTSKLLAEEYVRAQGKNFRVEEHPIDPPFENCPPGVRAYSCSIHYDGKVFSEEASHERYKEYQKEPFSHAFFFMCTHVPIVKVGDPYDAIRQIYLLAKDEEHAIHRLTEMHSQMIVLGTWPKLLQEDMRTVTYLDLPDNKLFVIP